MPSSNAPVRPAVQITFLLIILEPSWRYTKSTSTSETLLFFKDQYTIFEDNAQLPAEDFIDIDASTLLLASMG